MSRSILRHMKSVSWASMGISMLDDLDEATIPSASGRVQELRCVLELLGQVITYARNQWSRAARYLNCGLHTPENNAAERMR